MHILGTVVTVLFYAKKYNKPGQLLTAVFLYLNLKKGGFIMRVRTSTFMVKNIKEGMVEVSIS